MKNDTFFLSRIALTFILLAFFKSTFCQESNWKYFRAANTGVCGEEHNFISSDKFGNIWTSGRSVGFLGEASVVRFDWQDTIFTCWSDFEGHLPSDFINDAKVDSLDVLWVATGEGLCRFNGNSWLTYDMTNTPLPSQNIRSVSFDQIGNVWISFQEINMNIGGVAKFNGNTWNIYTPTNSALPHHECYDVLINPDNTIWIQSQFSMTHFDGLNFTNYDSSNSPIAGIQIFDSFLDETGNLYIITQGPQSSEISIYDGTNWSYINATNNPYFQNYSFYSFFKRENKMIIGGSNTVLTFDGNNWQLYPSLDFLHDVHIDPSNHFWVSTQSALSYLSEDGWKDFSRYSSGISEDFIENIFIDSHNRFWAANGNGGVHVYDCPKWQMFGPYNQGLYPSPQSLSTIGSTICEDSFGNIWFAYNSTAGTVVKIPGGNYQEYEAWVIYDNSDFPISYIEESIADGFGNVFFYSDYGTFMFNNSSNEWTFWDLTNSPLQYYSYGFGRDNNGIAYFGGFQQIATYANGVWDIINLSSVGSGFITVNDIEFDENNTLWIATDEGLWKRDIDGWVNWNTTNSNIISNFITSVEIKSNNEVWVSGFTAAGFLNGGIGKLNQSQDNWTNYNSSNSALPAEQIDDIELDLNENLWINSYPRGITIFNENGLVGFDCQDFSLQGVGGVGIKEKNSENKIKMTIAPNPCQHTTSIKFYLNTTDPIQGKCINSLGQVMIEFSIPVGSSYEKNFELNTAPLPDGAYTIALENGLSSHFIKTTR